MARRVGRIRRKDDANEEQQQQENDDADAEEEGGSDQHHHPLGPLALGFLQQQEQSGDDDDARQQQQQQQLPMSSIDNKVITKCLSREAERMSDVLLDFLLSTWGEQMHCLREGDHDYRALLQYISRREGYVKHEHIGKMGRRKLKHQGRDEHLGDWYDVINMMESHVIRTYERMDEDRQFRLNGKRKKRPVKELDRMAPLGEEVYDHVKGAGPILDVSMVRRVRARLDAIYLAMISRPIVPEKRRGRKKKEGKEEQQQTMVLPYMAPGGGGVGGDDE